MQEFFKKRYGRQKKVKRVLSWVKETNDEKRIIGPEIITDVYTWIYSSYAVHSDMRSQIEEEFSMEHGVLHKNLSVQRF